MAHTLRGLYVIIDPAVAGEHDLSHVAREAIAGGAAIVQWRDKTREKGPQLADVRALAEIGRASCRERV